MDCSWFLNRRCSYFLSSAFPIIFLIIAHCCFVIGRCSQFPWHRVTGAVTPAQDHHPRTLHRGIRHQHDISSCVAGMFVLQSGLAMSAGAGPSTAIIGGRSSTTQNSRNGSSGRRHSQSCSRTRRSRLVLPIATAFLYHKSRIASQRPLRALPRSGLPDCRRRGGAPLRSRKSARRTFDILTRGPYC